MNIVKLPVSALAMFALALSLSLSLAHVARAEGPATVTAAPVLERNVPARLVILDFSSNGVDVSLVKSVTESVAVTLQQEAVADDVVTAADLRAMMNVEANKRSLGDCDFSDACMAEIAQALGADVIVHGSVGRFGDLYVVTLNAFDARANRAAARERAESERLELLSRRIEHASRRLALACSGKSVELAGPTPHDDDEVALGSRAMLWAGAIISVTSATVAVAGGALAASAAATLENPTSSRADKDDAEAGHPIFLTSAIVAGLVAVCGAGVAIAGSIE